jgi:chaperonin GroES
MIDLEPLGDRVVLKRIDDDAEMQKGLHVPEVAQVKSSKGRVVAVGEGRLVGNQLLPLPLQVGDIVLFSKYGAVEVNLDGEEYLILRYDEIYFRQKLIITGGIASGNIASFMEQ